MSAETLNLVGFHPDMRDLIGAAIDMGWSAHQERPSGRGPGTVTLHAYDGSQTIRATPVRQINQAKLETMRRKVVRYADPVKNAVVLARLHQAKKQGKDDIEQVKAALPSGVEAILHDEVTVPGREVVEQRPWLAKRAPGSKGGTKYESQAVVERVWSDGEVDYICPYEGCGWNSVKPQSVARHYASHVKKAEAPPTHDARRAGVVPVSDYTEPTKHNPYHPTERLIEALTEYLNEHLIDGDGVRGMALAALTWAHERPDLPDVVEQSREPLTAEGMVERIRMIVGAPLASRLAEAEDDLRAQADQIAGLQADLLVRDATIERLREERRALAALMSEEEPPSTD